MQIRGHLLRSIDRSACTQSSYYAAAAPSSSSPSISWGSHVMSQSHTANDNASHQIWWTGLSDAKGLHYLQIADSVTWNLPIPQSASSRNNSQLVSVPPSSTHHPSSRWINWMHRLRYCCEKDYNIIYSEKCLRTTGWWWTTIISPPFRFSWSVHLSHASDELKSSRSFSEYFSHLYSWWHRFNATISHLLVSFSFSWSSHHDLCQPTISPGLRAHFSSASSAATAAFRPMQI